MITAQFDESLVEGVRDDVMVVIARLKRAVTEGLDLQGGTHSPELEIPKPEFAVGKPASWRARSNTSFIGVDITRPVLLDGFDCGRRVESTTSTARWRRG